MFTTMHTSHEPNPKGLVCKRRLTTQVMTTKSLRRKL